MTCVECEFPDDTVTVCSCGEPVCGVCLERHWRRCAGPERRESNGGKFGLRPYQAEAVERVLEQLIED